MLSKSSSQTHPVQNHQNYGLAIKAIIQQVETASITTLNLFPFPSCLKRSIFQNIRN